MGRLRSLHVESVGWLVTFQKAGSLDPAFPPRRGTSGICVASESASYG